MNGIKKSSLIRSGDGQAIKVPPGFELPGSEVTVTKDGQRLIVEPAKEPSGGPLNWAELLDQMETIDVEWPDVDEGLLPLKDVEL